ncbi:glycyl-tRNA synthetase beta chain [Legionella adelaidensis]|uniref:Glycine--tRNA ligase beta subunit n=1 Tax=Legionella adelaidensis TaxID=45056 RepID=A0A0W0R3E3_9GAMM|nr:glycine--tRNA ligase subunit beta [Legionella adelaidensis]KTC65563.1 glycyl-tRNA synthetase beta chain [Legionella adelaidensis]
MSNDLLVEIGCEELPSQAVRPLAEALANNITAALLNEKLTHGKVTYFAAPRRIAVLVYDVQTKQEDKKISRKGPACAMTIDDEGRPTQALLGFARSCGVRVEDLSTEKTNKGEWWVYETQTPGAQTIDLLPELINQAVNKLPIAKPMRWGEGEVEFARPVHWVVLLFGEHIIKTKVLGVNTGNQSVGHRFHYPQAIEVTSPRLYESILHDAFVIADFEERKKRILEQVQELSNQKGFTPIIPENLLEEVTSIVEWPNALMAHFEKEFLNVPAEALIAAMQVHQKCFALRDHNHQLVPYFITVANIASNNTAQVIKGNEKVMRARLSDADFFFKQDKKRPLIEYREATMNVIFQTGLGSLFDKSLRLEAFMEYLIQPLNLVRNQAMRAATLSKCDLMTGMVGEFPELQGLMGFYYAQNDKEDEPVATALYEQYLPRFSADELPQSPLGVALSLADRMDTLVGNFSLGQKPSGTKDPFKLRRHALAIVRLLLTNSIEINLSSLIQQGIKNYGNLALANRELVDDVKSFILERLQSYYQAQGISGDFVLAVLKKQDDWLYDFDRRLKALVEFSNVEAASSLSAACKRVNNLLQHADSKDNCPVDSSLLKEPAEKALLQHVEKIEQAIAPLYTSSEYNSILNLLASLKEPVDGFFDHVMVMVDEPQLKQNRLRLLLRLQGLLQGIADISQLQLVA